MIVNPNLKCVYYESVQLQNKLDKEQQQNPLSVNQERIYKSIIAMRDMLLPFL